MRMTAKDFERLVILVGPKISKMDTKFQKAIPVQDRLAITLRFLAHRRLLYQLAIFI
nr:unnamed protein product [Callosobruchus chinensis]